MPSVSALFAMGPRTMCFDVTRCLFLGAVRVAIEYALAFVPLLAADGSGGDRHKAGWYIFIYQCTYTV